MASGEELEFRVGVGERRGSRSLFFYFCYNTHCQDGNVTGLIAPDENRRGEAREKKLGSWADPTPVEPYQFRKSKEEKKK